MKFFKNGQLNDSEIVGALHEAAEWYEDGAIAETRDLLVEIVDAIDAFCENAEG